MDTIRIPVSLKVILPLIFGILCTHFGCTFFSFWFLWIFLFLSVLSISIRKKNAILSQILFTFFITGFFFILGSYLKYNTDTTKKENHFSKLLNDKNNLALVQLSETPAENERWYKSEANVLQINDSSCIGKIQVYLEKDSSKNKPEYGDQILISSYIISVQEPANPSEFNYKNYLALHDIHHQSFVRKNEWIKTGSESHLIFSSINSIKEKCKKIISESPMSEKNIAVAHALILGDKNMLSDELMLSYASTGALHVLAVSGLHVGIILLMLTALFNPVKRIKNGKIIFLLLILSGIWFYAFLTGLSPSVFRAAIMFSFVAIGNYFERDTSIYQSLLVSAILLLLLDPNILFQIGFLLSYAAVFGIVFFYPLIYTKIHFKHKFFDKTWQILSVSIAAQLSTLPISLYFFHQFPNYFLITNLIVIPLSFIVLFVGIASIFLNFIPILSTILFYMLDLSLSLLNGGVEFIESLPFAVSYGWRMTWFQVILLYTFILGVTIALINRSKFYFVFSIVSITIFVLINLREKIERNSKNEITFYSVKENIVVDIFSGENFESISSENIDTSKMRFHVYPHRTELTGFYETDKNTILSETKRLFEFEKKKILFADQIIFDSLYHNDLPICDAYYLYDINFLSKNVLDKLDSLKAFLILGDNIKFATKKIISSNYRQTHFWDLKKNGALVVKYRIEE